MHGIGAAWRPPETDCARLPAERAFVAQLRAPEELGDPLLFGRVEHMASGSAGHFASIEELIAFITNVLAGTPRAGRLVPVSRGS